MTDEVKRQAQIDLDNARRELDSWHEYDSRRSDGSSRQDRLHEDRGDDLRRKVRNLETLNLEDKLKQP